MFQLFVHPDIEISQHRKYCGAKKKHCAILNQISKLLVIVEQLPVATHGKFMLPFFDLRGFNAISVLSCFLHFCGEQKLTHKSCLWSKNDKKDVC